MRPFKITNKIFLKVIRKEYDCPGVCNPGGYNVSMCDQMVTSEIREWFHTRFVQKAQEIIGIWTKHEWNYSLILRVNRLITF